MTIIRWSTTSQSWRVEKLVRRNEGGHRMIIEATTLTSRFANPDEFVIHRNGAEGPLPIAGEAELGQGRVPRTGVSEA
jgi:hypothetical protein